MALPVNEFIVSQRKGDNLDSLNNYIGDRPTIKVISTDQNSLSSTVTRARVKSGATLNRFTSPNIEKIIHKKKSLSALKRPQLTRTQNCSDTFCSLVSTSYKLKLDESLSNEKRSAHIIFCYN